MSAPLVPDDREATTMLRTPFCDRFGLDHPIVSAPMGERWAGAALAAAVSAAGGLGLIGGQIGAVCPDQAAWLRGQIQAVRARTDRPFGVGFIIPVLRAFDQADLPRVALEEGVAAVAYSFGDPTPYVAAVHAAGAKVMVQVQTVAQARRAVAAGADVVAAQGTDGGGHVGEIGTLSLVPAVVDAVGDVPVLAAGGITDARGLAAALLLGAAGVWLGTRFVASEEWGGEAWRRAPVVAAGTDDTIRTLAYDRAWDQPFPDGIAARVVRNTFTEQWHGREAELVGRRAEVRPWLDAADAAGDVQFGWVGAGQGVGLVDAVAPAGAIVRQLVDGAERLLRERPVQVLR
jgi:nitronate monooxygenase